MIIYYFEKKKVVRKKPLDEVKLNEAILNYGDLEMILNNGKAIARPLENKKVAKANNVKEEETNNNEVWKVID